MYVRAIKRVAAFGTRKNLSEFRPLCSVLLYLVERDAEDATLLTRNIATKPNYKQDVMS